MMAITVTAREKETLKLRGKNLSVGGVGPGIGGGGRRSRELCDERARHDSVKQREVNDVGKRPSPTESAESSRASLTKRHMRFIYLM